MRRTRGALPSIGLALTCLGLASCTETVLAPRDATSAVDAPGVSQALGQGVVQSVTGNGHTVGDPPERTRVFAIRKYSDGSVDGWYWVTTRGPGGAQIRARLDCLHVVGNQAWAAGTIIAAVNPDNIGRPIALRFVDNGEGANAPPDAHGGIWAEYDCATEPDLPLTALTIGNLQVRE